MGRIEGENLNMRPSVRVRCTRGLGVDRRDIRPIRGLLFCVALSKIADVNGCLEPMNRTT